MLALVSLIRYFLGLFGEGVHFLRPLCYALAMKFTVDIIGAGLAGSEAALQLARRGVNVRLYEMRPEHMTPVHLSGLCAELVCSNSLKSTKPESAAGMLKYELTQLESSLLEYAYDTRVAAGGALAVDRSAFASTVTRTLERNPFIELVREEVTSLPTGADALIIASGPLTSDSLARSISEITSSEYLSFFDAAAPIVMADSLDHSILFRQSRYEEGAEGDYLNAPFDKQGYESFIKELCAADRVILKEFESKELFAACQPIEEIARRGIDAPRYGTMKPVGLVDPSTGSRPWAALQLRAEDAYGSSYNLVGFQTNLTFSEQERVFRMIPGLEHAEFVRYGVMHRNTFVDAPLVLDSGLRLKNPQQEFRGRPVFFAGQLCGTEGYCEAIMSGLWAALSVYAAFKEVQLPTFPATTSFGALLAYATDEATKNYQPMHVNFGIMPPLEKRIRNKKERYEAYARRGNEAFRVFLDDLVKEQLFVSETKGIEDD